jgi:Protein of unknown function (DUF3761)
MFLRATVVAAAVATATVGWAAPSNAQSPIAAATTAPTSPVISADDECGDGWEWSKTGGRCVPVPAAAPTAPPGATFLCVDGDYSFAKTSRGACSRHGGIKAAIGQ